MNHEARNVRYGVGNCIRPDYGSDRMSREAVGIISFITGMMFIQILDMALRASGG